MNIKRCHYYLATLSALTCLFLLAGAPRPSAAPLSISREHPRLLGSRQALQDLAKKRPAEYQRMARVARDVKADNYSRMISLALVAAIEGDKDLAQQAQALAMKLVTGPIRQGHVPFGTDLALCALVYDLCSDAWSPADRQKLFTYLNQTVDANVKSETHVFHNAWYGYKNWGIGLAALATYHENPRAPAILATVDEDFRTRAAPALELAGAGGGWAEGYYIHYFLYEWLFFCEAARRCGGVDYYALAPKFFSQRAVAGMFETYPGLDSYKSRRCVPMGDGGGRLFGGDRDKELSAQRLLASYYQTDPAHQAVQAFDELTPRSSVGNYAYKDFLWHDATLPKGDLARFKLSHCSPGPGYVYARSSWQDEATYFFFKCGDRFTAHQHLDVNHFLIYKYAELAGDGGHYDDFGSSHDVNYHLRTIAHNTVLVLDPEEKWRSNIRAGTVTGNDGGQHYPWPHHNGALADVNDWLKQQKLCDIADLLAFEDRGDYLYAAGDATRAYAPKKLELFTRQVVYLRPDTFVIFDRVKATRPEFKKTWLLQAMQKPSGTAPNLVVTNGKGRLFVQTLLPENPQVILAAGEDLYQYGGQAYPPKKDTGPAPACRIEISPPRPAAVDYFLHVLTAAGAETESVPKAAVKTAPDHLQVQLGDCRLVFTTGSVGGSIEQAGRRTDFAATIR